MKRGDQIKLLKDLETHPGWSLFMRHLDWQIEGQLEITTDPESLNDFQHGYWHGLRFTRLFLDHLIDALETSTDAILVDTVYSRDEGGSPWPSEDPQAIGQDQGSG